MNAKQYLEVLRYPDTWKYKLPDNYRNMYKLYRQHDQKFLFPTNI